MLCFSALLFALHFLCVFYLLNQCFASWWMLYMHPFSIYYEETRVRCIHRLVDYVRFVYLDYTQLCSWLPPGSGMTTGGTQEPCAVLGIKPCFLHVCQTRTLSLVLFFSSSLHILKLVRRPRGWGSLIGIFVSHRTESRSDPTLTLWQMYLGIDLVFFTQENCL